MSINGSALTDICFETSGDGEPLVLIPGFTSGMWSWFCQGGLADRLRIVTFDPRGIGRSPAGDTVPSLDTFVDDVVSVMDAAGLERASILGTSFGGFVAQAFALRHPGRVDKLILACTSAGGPGHVRPDLEILRSFTRDPSRPADEQIRSFLQPAFTDRFKREHADVFERVCDLRQQNAVAESVYAAQLQAAFSFDASTRLGEIECKTLVISGDEDKLVPVENSVNLAAGIPNAELHIIRGGSHMIFVENADEFNQTVLGFIADS